MDKKGLIFAEYQESVIPLNMEDIGRGIDYFDEFIQFRASEVKLSQSKVEKLTGIKEVKHSIALKVKYEAIPIHFKVNDKVFVFGQEYRVIGTEMSVPEKFQIKVSRNPRLYDRYAEKVLVLE